VASVAPSSITKTILQQGGWVMIPDGPGLGVEIDRAALEKYRMR
jgi:L-alanine-DL-glutamate epimerase-like enolase superfamily enzyme